MTKVLLEELAESGVVVWEAMGVYDAAGADGTGGGRACGGRSVMEDEVPAGPPKSEGRLSAPGVDNCAITVTLVVSWFV
jgi:hypothetical protein